MIKIRGSDNVEQNSPTEAGIKVKLSRYTPWWRMGGEEV
jgi:hypothetical protein